MHITSGTKSKHLFTNKKALWMSETDSTPEHLQNLVIACNETVIALRGCISVEYEIIKPSLEKMHRWKDEIVHMRRKRDMYEAQLKEFRDEKPPPPNSPTSPPSPLLPLCSRLSQSPLTTMDDDSISSPPPLPPPPPPRLPPWIEPPKLSKPKQKTVSKQRSKTPAPTRSTNTKLKSNK